MKFSLIPGQIYHEKDSIQNTDVEQEVAIALIIQ
jgi:hypothetical protein